MQERCADDVLHCPLIVEMKSVGGDDRLVGQDGGFVLATVVWEGWYRKYCGIGEVRAAEILRDGVYIGILAVEKSVGPDRYLVSESEQIEFSVQRCRVAGDGEMRNGIEVFGDRIIPEIVSQGIGDAEQIAHGILIEAADFNIPIVVEFMLYPDETCVGDEVRARARLPVTDPGRVNGGRQHDVRLAEGHDTARQARDVGFGVGARCL